MARWIPWPILFPLFVSRFFQQSLSFSSVPRFAGSIPFSSSTLPVVVSFALQNNNKHRIRISNCFPSYVVRASGARCGSWFGFPRKGAPLARQNVHRFPRIVARQLLQFARSHHELSERFNTGAWSRRIDVNCVIGRGEGEEGWHAQSPNSSTRLPTFQKSINFAQNPGESILSSNSNYVCIHIRLLAVFTTRRDQYPSSLPVIN